MTTNTLIAKLQQRLTALGDGRDCASDNERATYRRMYDGIQRVIGGLRSPDLDKPTALLSDCESRRTMVLQKQSEIEQQLTHAPDPRTLSTTRERDQAYDRQQELRRQLQRLHDGTLLIAPGIAAERLADLDARIKELTARRDRAQRAFDAHVQQAAALLGETPYVVEVDGVAAR